MGGKITVESQVGSGSTFMFELNYKEGSVEKISEQKSGGEVDGTILNGLKILIADDNEFNRTVASDTLLAHASVEIELVENGSDAIRRLSEKKFDVVLMDVQMPVMNGYEATRHIRDPESGVRDHSIPVIALTASVVRSDLDKCRLSGMNDYVPKPFQASQLFSAIAKATGRELKFVPKKNIETVLSSGNDAGITDLAYLRNFCEGDEARMAKYIRMFLDTAPPLTEKIISMQAENDLEGIANHVHGYKTKWIMMGMKGSRELATLIEEECRNGKNSELLRNNIAMLVAQVARAAEELKQWK